MSVHDIIYETKAAVNCVCLYSVFFVQTGLKSLKLIYFTTITKQVLQLILIMLFGTDVSVWVVFLWEETGVTGVNPPA